jgi:Ca2+/Na+ antiporter
MDPIGKYLLWAFIVAVALFIVAFLLLICRSRRLCDEMIERAKAEYDRKQDE